MNRGIAPEPLRAFFDELWQSREPFTGPGEALRQFSVTHPNAVVFAFNVLTTIGGNILTENNPAFPRARNALYTLQIRKPGLAITKGIQRVLIKLANRVDRGTIELFTH